MGKPAAEKSRYTLIINAPVPQTDTGSWVENTKALERFTVKELGKIVL